MKLLGNIFRYIGVFVAVSVISSLFAHESWSLYDSIFHEVGSSWIDLSDVAGLAFNYALLTAVFVESLGERYRHWVLGLFYFPLLVYEYGMDFIDLKTMFILVILGVVVGVLIRLLATRTLGEMPRFEPLKKYF